MALIQVTHLSMRRELWSWVIQTIEERMKRRDNPKFVLGKNLRKGGWRWSDDDDTAPSQYPYHHVHFTCVTTYFRVQFKTGRTINETGIGASVDFYTTREGTCNGGASQQYRNIGCNSCVDPPGDWWDVQVFDIGGDIRINVHNQDNCTPSSQVGQ
ncbi:hypothetical protein BJ165DRAFT_1405440 [Panaeolus papilionaceus]|nr:hypothetical protein BJ165DRAFT_1405440 [Panaeolus papilionaceus]